MAILTLSTTTANTTFNLHTDIPRQPMVLKNVKVEYDSAANSLADDVIYIDTPWLGAFQLTDGNANFSRLPIPLDNAIVTLYQPDIIVELQEHIRCCFNMKVLTAAGALVTNMQSITLQFEYSVSTIS